MLKYGGRYEGWAANRVRGAGRCPGATQSHRDGEEQVHQGGQAGHSQGNGRLFFSSRSTFSKSEIAYFTGQHTLEQQNLSISPPPLSRR